MICFYLTHFILVFYFTQKQPFDLHKNSYLISILIYGLKWVKREYSLPQILNLARQNFSKEVLLAGPKNQTKFPSPSGDWVLGEVELYTLPLMAMG